jgi:hypothetical protein
MSSFATPSKIVLLFAVFLILATFSPVAQPSETSYDTGLETPSHPDVGFTVSDASGDVYDGTGDWIITQPTVYTDNLSIVVNGDVLIQSGGSLTLNNSAINMNVTGSIVEVSAGGYLEGTDSYVLAEGGGASIQGEFSMDFYGNVSWTGGYIRHFSEITFQNSTVNATFTNTDIAYATGRINIRYAHSVSFSGCDFYEIDCSDNYLIQTITGGVSFEGGILVENCRFGSEYWSAPTAGNGLIYAVNYASGGDFKIVSNLFYELEPSLSTYVIELNYVNGNSTIADNEFIRCDTEIMYIDDNECIARGNKFFGNDVGTFKNSHVIFMRCNDSVIERNLFWNNTVDSEIVVDYGNNTIRYNIILESVRKAIEIHQEADGCLVYGNALHGNNVGIYIWEEADSQQIYLNAFMQNSQHAIDKDGDDPISWDNGTHGNFWDNYTGSPSSGNPWVGDTAFQPHENITDSYPTFMIGELPPSTGNWVTDIPNLFAVNDLSIDGDVEVNGPTGLLLLIGNSLQCGAGNSFTFGESSVFML